MPARTAFLVLALTVPAIPAGAQQPFPGPAPRDAARAVDPLPSWNDGEVKRTILRFVAEATDPFGPKVIAPADRIATFDQDGTLWAEKPAYFLSLFLAKRIRDLAPEHPEWARQPTLAAVIRDDIDAIAKAHTYELMALAPETHAGVTEDQFEAIVADYLDSARHPRFGVRLTDLVYPPMIELMAFLERNQFKVFICSGATTGFTRTFSESAYGVARDRVIGTDVMTQFRAGKPGMGGDLVRLPGFVEPINDVGGKPVNIDRRVGRRPVLAFGNSDGDIPMLESAEGPRPHLSLLLRHDDADREYAYDARSEAALALAPARGWTVVSMRRDFQLVFPKPRP